MTTKYDNKPFFFNDESIHAIEKQTFANIMDEAVFLHGSECIWIKQTLGQREDIFGEFLGKKINEGIPIRLVLDQVDTDLYPEDTMSVGRYGLELNIGEATWHGSVQYFTDHGITPGQQDLIYYKKIAKLFEVTHIQLLDDYKYVVNSILYNYSHEPVASDVTDEDILSLPDLDDKDKAATGDRIAQVEEDDNVLNTDESDGIFD
jgi:hypothetical protein